MKPNNYDIFICYRREDGADTAKHLRDILASKGYSVFFDTDSLRSGSFNLELIDVIRNCRDFIIILSPNSLNRCVNEDDWVRKELSCALEAGKNVIPVMSRNFSFPDSLPKEIDNIRWKNGIAVNIEYFDAMVEKLISFLTSKPHKRKIIHWIILAVILCALVTAAVSQIIISARSNNNNDQEETAISEDYLASLSNRGDDAYNSGDYSTAYNLYQIAADSGYAPAQYSLGFMYLEGLGVEPSFEKGLEYTIKSAEQSYAPAQSNLGYMYQYGLGTEQSYEKAIELYQLAADQGDASGLSNLGVMYDYGLGVAQSYEKALEYYLLAADQGYPAALNNLGNLYENGLGVEQSYEKALEYYQAAADKGYKPAQELIDQWARNGTPAPVPQKDK